MLTLVHVFHDGNPAIYVAFKESSAPITVIEGASYVLLGYVRGQFTNYNIHSILKHLVEGKRFVLSEVFVNFYPFELESLTTFGVLKCRPVKA